MDFELLELEIPENESENISKSHRDGRCWLYTPRSVGFAAILGAIAGDRPLSVLFIDSSSTSNRQEDGPVTIMS